MENLDLIILTLIVVISFIVFGVSTFNEFSIMSKSKFKGEERNKNNF